MVEVLTSFGEKFTKSEARKLVQNEDSTGEGLIDYEGDISIFHWYFDKYCFLALCTKLIPTYVTEKKTEKDSKNQK